MYNQNSKAKNKSLIFKMILSIILFILLGFGTNIYLNTKYNQITSNFYKAFNNYEFSTAKLIFNKKILLPKKKQLNSDLNNYFVDVVDKISTSLLESEINTDEALNILLEIKSYNILNSSLDKFIIALNSNELLDDIPSNSKNDINNKDNPNNSIASSNENYLNLGILAFNEENYSKAMKYFTLIPKSSKEDYNFAKDYIIQCKKNYKNYLLETSDELIANKYYTNAIELLSNYDSDLLSKSDIKEIENKISSAKLFREEYQGDDSEYTSNAILEAITIDNVNKLTINSKTNYFIYLNLKEQITYIYEGSNNNWNLIKEFPCSTGLEGKETPKGIFSITDRGEWFFSEEFGQGGKYWVQFMGDYLFHSIPFDETQSVVLDYTLGEPASHGCVRLSIEDEKWLYDNVPNDTKVIIN